MLLDYIIKYHHRNTKEKGAYLLSMIENVKDNYGMEYPELNELFNQVKLSMHDLESHFQKEESVLFPYLYELFDASHNEEYIETMVRELAPARESAPLLSCTPGSLDIAS